MNKQISRRQLIVGAVGLGASTFSVPIAYSQLGIAYLKQPAARDHFAATFDENRKALVVFGGSSGPHKCFNDTWEWINGLWREVNRH